MTIQSRPESIETAVAVDQWSDAAWNSLLPAFDDGLFEQLSRPANGAHLGLSRLVLRRGQRLAGAAQVILIRPFGLRSGIAYVKFGPMWRPKDAEPLVSDLKALVAALIHEYAHKRRLHVTVQPPPDPEFAGMVAAALIDGGLRRRPQTTDPHRYLVDLGLSRDEQHQSLASKWRYNLRKAEQHGLSVSLDDRPEAYAAFASLYASMVARKRFRDTSSYADLNPAFDHLPPPLRPRPVLVGHDGEIVAGALISRIGKTGTYLFGATNGKGLELNAGYALHWWITAWLSQTGTRWYDLGGEAGDPGLRQFKKGLVGKRGRIVELAGEFDYCADRASALTAQAIFAMRGLVQTYRDVADRAASGRLLRSVMSK